MIGASEVSELLSAQAERVARHLLPAGKKIGNEWRVGNLQNDPGKSLGVHLNGDRAGLWCDFSDGHAKGDLLDLWAYTRCMELSEALREARAFLGLAVTEFVGHKMPSFQRPKIKICAGMTDSPQYEYLMRKRRLTLETLEAFKIGVVDRKIVFPYIRDGETVFVKYLSLDRIDGKKQISAEANCEPCLFGWHLIPQNCGNIVICEGEIDAMTLHQYGLSALSVPFGAGVGAKHKWIEFEFDRLEVFEEIYLCFDNDEEGRKATDYLLERLGRYRCRIVELPLKDPNDCLLSGMSRNILHSYFDNAITRDPVELKSANHYVNEVVDWFYPPDGILLGYKAPWFKTQDKILFRNAELSVWTGINGHGKSQFLGHILLHQIGQGAKVCIASLELKPHLLLGKLCRQAGALNKPSQKFIEEIFKFYQERLWIFDLVGTASSKRLLEVFLYARQRYGIDVFVIDSFLKLDIAEDDYKNQKLFLNELCDFKNEHNCHIHLIAHPRKGVNESTCPGKLDTKGTGAISDLADNCFGIWRNKEKEFVAHLDKTGMLLTPTQIEKLKEADGYWYCDKQRNGEWEGKFSFWFDTASGQYLASDRHKPIPFVEFYLKEEVSIW